MIKYDGLYLLLSIWAREFHWSGRDLVGRKEAEVTKGVQSSMILTSLVTLALTWKQKSSCCAETPTSSSRALQLSKDWEEQAMVFITSILEGKFTSLRMKIANCCHSGWRFPLGNKNAGASLNPQAPIHLLDFPNTSTSNPLPGSRDHLFFLYTEFCLQSHHTTKLQGKDRALGRWMGQDQYLP